MFANNEKLLVSSTKSYFGHNIGAAGIVELIACLVTLPDNRVLPTLNFTNARQTAIWITCQTTSVTRKSTSS